MKKIKNIEDLVTYLEPVTSNILPGDRDDFMIYDWAGGNLDDAYSLGVEHGRKDLASELLKKVEIQK